MHDPLRITLKQDETPEERPRPRRRPWKRLAMPLVVLALFLALLGYGGYFIFSHILRTPSVAGVPKDTSAIVAKVGQLMLLPDETPTVALVSDLSKLKGQPFFAHAQTGDVVLMYPHAGRAILWSPSKNLIIEVAPITNSQPQ